MVSNLLFEKYLKNPVSDISLSIEQQNNLNAAMITLVYEIENFYEKNKLAEFIKKEICNFRKKLNEKFPNKEIITREIMKMLILDILYYLRDSESLSITTQEFKQIRETIIYTMCGYND